MTSRVGVPRSIFVPLLLATLSASSACTVDPVDLVQDTETSTSTAATDTDGSESTGSGSTGSGSGTTAGTGGTSGGSGTTGGTDGATTGSVGDCRTIFVNFDGPTLTSGADDPSNDRTQISQLAIDLEPYGGTEQDAIIATMRTHWESFNVCVTQERPESGSYDMVVVTASNPIGAGVNGTAPLDCQDSGFNIAFTFSAELNATEIATVSSGGLGSTFGLEKVVVDTDLNYGDVPQDTAGFTDACLELSQGGPCGSQHAAFCPAGEQNAFQELLDILGPAQ